MIASEFGALSTINGVLMISARFLVGVFLQMSSRDKVVIGLVTSCAAACCVALLGVTLTAPSKMKRE